ncbi:hypothetical protein FNV43_RR09534 [Rhamnella rubrinervis]|uniref:Acid phosphatase/vanadium-dependent haloperoxidase-related protein n=1 Tax=Rhamnella rubrinervis TaxID=2594499 RepID=A0A8K0MJW6_9ROSA|nr:hypothetical protein FNV43_RR09534 [Rhamnella rubrinervis]
MLWHCWSIPSVCPPPSPQIPPSKKHQSLHFEKPLCFRTPKSSMLTCPRAQFSEEIAQLAHNKVLIAAGVSAAIGQLSKPFTSVILYGKDFNLKAAIQAGGFPSTHSSAVVATAACLGLERGLSDSIFGLTVVYASLTMYDAQGVRREVGVHAKMLNNVLQTKSKKVNCIPTRDRYFIDSQPGTSSPLNLDRFFGPDELPSEEATYLTSKTAKNPYKLKETSSQMQQIPSPSSSCEVAGDVEEERNSATCSTPLKESIGHTEVEVAAGALLGFLVSLAVHALL